MNRKNGGPQISLLGRCGRKNTQLSSSTIASDPWACSCKSTHTYVNVTDRFSLNVRLPKSWNRNASIPHRFLF
ncbi:hypothetical protein HanIR_Chr17g0900221 [Helianthus annuus]|nr:hypothetical protein HanIR_Chr17g0900221 [Helianthus annuus]